MQRRCCFSGQAQNVVFFETKSVLHFNRTLISQRKSFIIPITILWIFRLVDIIQQEKLILIDDFLPKVFSPKAIICHGVLKEDAVLKGQCHEDFAVLGQFWAKTITLSLYSKTKRFFKTMTRISNEFYHRGLTIINFLRIF